MKWSIIGNKKRALVQTWKIKPKLIVQKNERSEYNTFLKVVKTVRNRPEGRKFETVNLMETTKKCKMALKAEELLERLNDLIEGFQYDAEDLKDFCNATESDEQSESNWYVLDKFNDWITAVENALDESL